jgi:hypothetical protein
VIYERRPAPLGSLDFRFGVRWLCFLDYLGAHVMMYRRSDFNLVMLRIGNIWHYCDPDGIPNGEYSEHSSYFQTMLDDGTMTPLERVYLAINLKTAQLMIVADGTCVGPDWKLITAPGGLFVL